MRWCSARVRSGVAGASIGAVLAQYLLLRAGEVMAQRGTLPGSAFVPDDDRPARFLSDNRSSTRPTMERTDAKP